MEIPELKNTTEMNNSEQIGDSRRASALEVQ